MPAKGTKSKLEPLQGLKDVPAGFVKLLRSHKGRQKARVCLIMLANGATDVDSRNIALQARLLESIEKAEDAYEEKVNDLETLELGRRLEETLARQQGSGISTEVAAAPFGASAAGKAS